MPIILGIAPGLAATGYGVIRREGSSVQCLDFGVIRTDADAEHGQRLAVIDEAVNELLLRYQPVKAGIEALYFTKNVTSAIPVAEARGVILLALHRAGILAREYTPQQIKLAVVGTGSADKEQVMQMVRVVLGYPTVPRPDHAADALAAAITRMNDPEDSLLGGH